MTRIADLPVEIHRKIIECLLFNENGVIDFSSLTAIITLKNLSPYWKAIIQGLFAGEVRQAHKLAKGSKKRKRDNNDGYE